MRFISVYLISVLWWITPVQAQKVCLLKCPDACSISADANSCTCNCPITEFKDVDQKNLFVESGGIRFKLGPIGDRVKNVGFSDAVKGILEPKEANPKGERGAVILKDDGSVGGHYRQDGEFVPGKPDNMK